MKKLYYRLLRDITAMKILAALVASPQRYEYIAGLVAMGKLNNRGATDKNVCKAIVMADQFIEVIKERNSLDD